MTQGTFSAEPIQFSESDWLEIYYAVCDKLDWVEEKNPTDEEEEIEMKADWAVQLNEILDKLGTDGESAYRQGTLGAEFAPARSRPDQPEHLGGRVTGEE